jgi:iron complex outermembrane recepter protein
MTNFVFSGEPSVAYHLDGAVISRAAAQIGAYYDLNRIEILRGPQGTLYGRNATGGSINVITNRPTAETAGYLDLTGGNYGLLEAEGAASGTVLDDVLLGRVAFQAFKRDGYAENPFLEEDIADADTQAARVGFSYVGSEDFDAFLSYNYVREDDRNYPVTMLGWANPNVVPPEIAVGGMIATNERDLNSELSVYNKKDIDSVTLEMNWELGEQYAIKSIGNYLNFNYQNASDLNGTPVQFAGGTSDGGSDQYSEELQFSFAGEKLSTLFGLYYFHEELHSDTVSFGPPVFTDVLMRPLIEFSGSQNSDSYAAFSNARWQFNDEWAASVGLRYSYDGKDDEGFNLIPTGVAIPIARDEDWDAWTPKLTAEYTPQQDLFFYATVSAGYKAGVMNIGNQGNAVDPENVWNYETGMKSEWWDNRFQLNTAVFYAEIDDLQVQRPEGGTLITVNAAKATTQGVELETITLLTEGLMLNVSGAYVDAQFDDFPTSNPTFAPNTPVNLSGNPLPSTPKWQGEVALSYDMFLDNGWSTGFKLQGIYTDERWFNEFKENVAYQDSTFVVNANVMIRTKDEKWSLNLWGRNLGDEDKLAHVSVSSAPVGFMRNAAWEPPRTYGATIGYNF